VPIGLLFLEEVDDMILEKARYEVVLFGKKLIDKGLVAGTGGNLSLRVGDLVAVSPSGVEYETMVPEDVVVTDMNGKTVEGCLKPSSETPLHLALYSSRGDISAVVHTHSPYACVMACLGWELPVFHYLVALAGKKVPVAPYACFGTSALAGNVVASIGEEKAVLMENHGLVTVGGSLREAFMLAEAVEFASKVFAHARSLGSPRLLDGEEIGEVVNALQHYGFYGENDDDLKGLKE
jgi:L-fuculose-phosphate aldolase